MPASRAQEDLTPPERRLLDGTVSGSVVELQDGESIRADVVVSLLCGEFGDVPAVGVRFIGGQVSGRINLADRELDRPLWMRRCKVEDGIDLSDSRCRGLSFSYTRFSGGEWAFFAQGLKVDGDVFLNQMEVEGRLVLSGVDVTGQISLSNSTFNFPDGCSVDLSGSKARDIFLTHAKLNGFVSLDSVQTSGPIEARGINVIEKTGYAIFASNISCSYLSLDLCNVEGGISLQHASMTGNVTLVDSLVQNDRGYGFFAVGLRAGNLILNGTFIKGGIDISRSVVLGQLSLNGSFIVGGVGSAISAESCSVGAWFMRPRARQENEEPQPTKIVGNLDLTSSIITDYFEAAGAQITGYTTAISARGLHSKGVLNIGAGCEIKGAVDLSLARITGRLQLTGSKIQSHSIAFAGTEFAGEHYSALDLSESEIAHLVMPNTADTRPAGIVDLSRARVGTLTDFSAAWPKPLDRSSRACTGRVCDKAGRDADHLVLDGFEYQHLDNPDGGTSDQDEVNLGVAATRLRWLHGQSRADVFARLKPQPWRQLAKILNSQGYEEDARSIAIQRRVAQRYAAGTSAASRTLSFFLHVLSDYGFNPWKTVGWSVGIVIGFAFLYWVAAVQGCTGIPLCAGEEVFVRTLAADFVPAISDEKISGERLAKVYPRFDPLLFSLDVFLPLVDAGSEKFWRPNSGTWLGGLLYYLLVIEQIVGAILVSLAVTGFTGLLTKDER